MLGGTALAQDTTYDDPSMTEDTAVTSDTSVAPDTSVDTTATTDANADATMSSDMHMNATTTDTTAATTSPSTTTGVGGPYEVAPTTTAMNAPSSKGGYPACDPGPGDDNCIQLYERGVSSPTNLAMNETLPGGSDTMMASADTSTPSTTAQTGVGGPYEPIDIASMGATSSKCDFPPCSGSPGDDICIQLYERGVTGNDN